MSAPKDAARNVFVALDTADLPAALALARRLAGHVAGVKLGLEFFAAHGPEGVRSFADSGQPIFLDLKLHDIPNTVAGAVKAILALEPAMITIHAGGGPAMLRAAAESARASVVKRPLVLAVTVLTSLDDDDLGLVGQAGPVGEQVARLARLAEDSGLDGVVCAPGDVARLRRQSRPGFTLVVPGIRPSGWDAHDQKRHTTPRAAIEAGADYLVIGRPITGAPDPLAALRVISDDIAGTSP